MVAFAARKAVKRPGTRLAARRQAPAARRCYAFASETENSNCHVAYTC